ncbi:MAG TPA: sulfur oxidation c-type cytochrome SoxX [Usitatibacter sp.]|nr:sulfur oxidation c-type cytochrome SoxX [Usitatibacter sp.]
MRLTLATWPLAAAALVLPCAAQQSQAPEAFVSPQKGHCIACHQVPPGAGPGTRADLGPALTGERMRALGKVRIREIIEDPTRANPHTVMPPFGRHRILEPGEIQRLVEYLHALP